ncbi:MAG: cytochrome-c peroxidase [Gammaproteobacteria bacterium]
MKILSCINLLFVIFILSACSGDDSKPADEGTITEVALGKLIFDDANLSANNYQACSTCHDATTGYTDPHVSTANPVSEGTLIDHFGKRNTPTSAYAQFSPAFSLTDDPVHGLVFSGGLFLDGRRDTLEEQAKGPMLSQAELAGAGKQAVVDGVINGLYVNRFMKVYGNDIFNNTDKAFDKIVQAIAVFERSDEMSPFNSKFDCFIKNAEQYPLSIQEQAGLDVFDGKGNCTACHTLKPQHESGKVLFTNFHYFNIGVPANPDNPANKANAKFVDLGLGGRLSDSAENGKFKTPTLRNIAKTAPYMHNGVFGTLEEVVAFYNIDKKESASPSPEVINNITSEVDTLSLNDPTDIDAVVAFMKTLTDGSGAGICF